MRAGRGLKSEGVIAKERAEILLKVARRKVPILISKSAPTNLAVKLANDLSISLIGFVRGKRMNAYTNEWRIVADRESECQSDREKP